MVAEVVLVVVEVHLGPRVLLLLFLPGCLCSRLCPLCFRDVWRFRPFLFRLVERLLRKFGECDVAWKLQNKQFSIDHHSFGQGDVPAWVEFVLEEEP